jgi:hypothetical protein
VPSMEYAERARLPITDEDEQGAPLDKRSA